MLEELKEKVYRANMSLVEHGLVILAGPAAFKNAEIQLPDGEGPLVLRRTAEQGKFRAAVHHGLVNHDRIIRVVPCAVKIQICVQPQVCHSLFQ